MRAVVKATLIILSAVLFVRCGGGSEGTGVGSSRTLEGQILTESGAPVVNAAVTLLDTGDSTTSDQAGNFLLPAPPDAEQLTLEVESGELKQNVQINDIDPDTTVIDVNLQVNDNGLITVNSFQIWSRIVGECEQYFDNRAVIRQIRRTPEEIQCTMRFFASGDGRRLERVMGEMQVRACNERVWRPIAQGRTGFGVNAGVGEIPFTFIDNQRNCEYRLAAPIGIEGRESLFIFLRTLTYLRQ